MNPIFMMRLGISLPQAAMERTRQADAIIVRRAPEGLRKVVTHLADDVCDRLDRHPELAKVRPISWAHEDDDRRPEVIGVASTVAAIAAELRGLLVIAAGDDPVTWLSAHIVRRMIERPSELHILAAAEALRVCGRIEEASRVLDALADLIAAGGWRAVDENLEAAMIGDGLKAEAAGDGD